MKRKVAKLRLSPNEEARIIREEHERRRKLRIQQVRRDVERFSDTDQCTKTSENTESIGG